MVRGYHLGFMQIDKGPFIVEAIQTQLAGVLLSAVHYGRALVHSGELPSGKITFAVGTSKVPALWQGRSLSLTLANFAGLSAARDPKHRIVRDDLMSAFEHKFHASHVAKGCPAAFHI